ncbi:hypothetical protein P7K49_014919, partial [Saguinus oedipus]
GASAWHSLFEAPPHGTASLRHSLLMAQPPHSTEPPHSTASPWHRASSRHSLFTAGCLLILRHGLQESCTEGNDMQGSLTVAQSGNGGTHMKNGQQPRRGSAGSGDVETEVSTCVGRTAPTMKMSDCGNTRPLYG